MMPCIIAKLFGRYSFPLTVNSTGLDFLFSDIDHCLPAQWHRETIR